MKIIYNIIILIISIVMMIIICHLYVSLKASNKLLATIEMLKPGINLDSVIDRLGSKLYDVSDADGIIELGSVKDKAFCQNKRFFLFYVSDPPSRGVEVYTDKNGDIVYVSWRYL